MTTNPQTVSEQVVIEWLDAQAAAVKARNPHFLRIKIEATCNRRPRELAFSIFGDTLLGLYVGDGNTIAEAEADLIESADPKEEAKRLRERLVELEGRQ